MPNIGPLEIVIVLVIVLVIFGPKRLPDLGRSLGTSMREFKDSVTGKDDDDDKQIDVRGRQGRAGPRRDEVRGHPHRWPRLLEPRTAPGEGGRGPCRA